MTSPQYPLLHRGREEIPFETPLPLYSPSNVLVYNWPVHECKKSGGKDSSHVICAMNDPRQKMTQEEKRKKICTCVCVRARAYASRGSSEPFFCTPYLSNTHVPCRILAGENGPSSDPIRGPEPVPDADQTK